MSQGDARVSVRERVPAGESWPIFRWSGAYFGFLRNGNLFDATGTYKGWLTDEGAVWRADGRFLGELVDDHYILRRQSMIEPIRRVPKVPPVRRVPRVPAIPRVPRIPRLGWVDALDFFEDG